MTITSDNYSISSVFLGRNFFSFLNSIETMGNNLFNREISNRFTTHSMETNVKIKEIMSERCSRSCFSRDIITSFKHKEVC